MGYQHILMTTDLTSNNLDIGPRALELAELYHAKLSLAHVVESLPGYASGYSGVVDLEEEMKQEAKQKLAEIGQELNIPGKDQYLSMGSPKFVILTIAQKIHADLIIVGGHGRHGLGKLLGSTASAILHEGVCDVLVVHKQEQH